MSEKCVQTAAWAVGGKKRSYQEKERFWVSFGEWSFWFINSQAISLQFTKRVFSRLIGQVELKLTKIQGGVEAQWACEW